MRLTPQLRVAILEELGSYGDEAVIAEAKSRFARYIDSFGQLSPELQPFVFTLVGTPSNWLSLVIHPSPFSRQQLRVAKKSTIGSSVSTPPTFPKHLD